MSRNTVNEWWTVRPDLKHKTDNPTLKPFVVDSVSIPELSSSDMIHSNHSLDITSDRINRLVARGCPMEWLIRLINSMMNIGATITKDRFGKFSVVVNTFNHMKSHIDEAIRTMIDRSFFIDLSFDDANKIILRLNLSKFIYCFEGHESGVCLVVLGPNVRAQNQYEQPWHLFQQEVRKFNDSRTIYMTPEQEKRLIISNQDFSKLVEFTFSFNKTTQQVIFKNNDLNVEIIRQTLNVEKLEKELSEAKRALEEKSQLKETQELQLRMFPDMEEQ